MASGDSVVRIIRETPPATLFAPLGARAGGSTPAEAIAHYAFDADTSEYLDLLCELKGYGGGGLTITLKWMAATATSGNVRWGAAIRRIADDAEDVDAAHTYDFNEVTAAAPTASGEFSYDSITFTDGADMDSLADGEAFVLRVYRHANDATNDTMAGDAQLVSVVGKET